MGGAVAGSGMRGGKRRGGAAAQAAAVMEVEDDGMGSDDDEEEDFPEIQLDELLEHFEEMGVNDDDGEEVL